MDIRIPAILAEIDSTCDYIPLVSTATNMIVLFNKGVFQFLPEEIAKNRYWTHINDKELSRCLILLVPVLGNIYIIVTDYFNYLEDQEAAVDQIQAHQQALQASAVELSRLAKVLTGKDVPPEKMMPAADERHRLLWNACARIKNFPDEIHVLRDQLINHGIEPNFFNSGTTPLVTACQYGTLKAVQFLVASGADVNTVDLLGNSPLGIACITGDLDKVRYLSDSGATIDLANPKGVTPLMLASACGHRDIVEFLLGRGANLRTPASDSRDALAYAISPNDDVDLLLLLIDKGENPDGRRYQYTVSNGPGLSSAAAVAAALLLLKEGADFLILDNENKTPFSIACEKRIGLVLEYIKLRHSTNLTPDMQAQLDVALKDQAPRQQTERGLFSAIDLMTEGLTAVRNDVTRRAAHVREVEDLGPLPRNSMELFIGQLPQTVF